LGPIIGERVFSVNEKGAPLQKGALKNPYRSLDYADFQKRLCRFFFISQ
jgi:hypothetical protein